MTTKELVEIKAYCDAATPGPWEYAQCGHDRVVRVTHGRDCQCASDEGGDCIGGHVVLREDARPSWANRPYDEGSWGFISRARTDLPRLVSALGEAQARIAELESEVHEWEESDAATSVPSPLFSEEMGRLEYRIDELVRERDEAREELEHLRQSHRRACSHITSQGEKLAACDITLAAMREAMEKEAHAAYCKSSYGRAMPCDCIKSHIPTGPDSAVVEAVKEVVAAEVAIKNLLLSGDADLTDTVKACERRGRSRNALVALAPESWKQTK